MLNAGYEGRCIINHMKRLLRKAYEEMIEKDFELSYRIVLDKEEGNY